MYTEDDEGDEDDLDGRDRKKLAPLLPLPLSDDETTPSLHIGGAFNEGGKEFEAAYMEMIGLDEDDVRGKEGITAQQKQEEEDLGFSSVDLFLSEEEDDNDEDTAVPLSSFLPASRGRGVTAAISLDDACCDICSNGDSLEVSI